MCAIYKFLCMFPNYFTSVMQYGGDQVEQARNAFWDTYVDRPERAYSSTSFYGHCRIIATCACHIARHILKYSLGGRFEFKATLFVKISVNKQS